MEKNVRIRIASQYQGVFKYEGLTVREFNARKQWLSLSPEDQAKRREIANKARQFICLEGRKDELVQTA